MFIDIEGIDGSGKGTQAQLLRERLNASGLSAESLDFPRYEENFFGREIARFLNGAFGELRVVHPKLAAVLYAGDRFESRHDIKARLARADVLVCDRYTPSNQAHNAAKLPVGERDAFFDWVDELEYRVFEVPRPDVILFLDVDANGGADLIRRKPPRVYTDRKADIHEVDASYQHEVYRAYQSLCSRPTWVRVPCQDDGALQSVDVVHERLWNALVECRLLPSNHTASER